MATPINSFQQQRAALMASNGLDPSLAQAVNSGIAALTGNANQAARQLSMIGQPTQTPLDAAITPENIARLSPEIAEQYMSQMPNQMAQQSAMSPMSPQVAQNIANFGSSNTSGNASAIREGLINRGLQPHIADAFVTNFKDESGLNSGINEANPIVAGSRGGFGLYQVTGPRRKAYESFAAQRGVSPDNMDAQLDFMVSELQGPESRAAKNIFSAPNTAAAAQAIVRDFLRPAPEHLRSRMARYAQL